MAKLDSHSKLAIYNQNAGGLSKADANSYNNYKHPQVQNSLIGGRQQNSLQGDLQYNKMNHH